jgi:hypothetical protein
MILIGAKIFGLDGEEYIVEELIGFGGFGQVFKVKNQDGMRLALKIAHALGMASLDKAIKVCG